MDLTLIVAIPMDDSDKASAFDRILPQYLGGEDVVVMLLHRYEEGRSFATIAQDRGVSRQAVQCRIANARRKMQSAGVWPSRWG